MKDLMFNFAYTTDLLIFGIDSRKNENTRELPKKYLSILLVKRKNEPYKDVWCLPGGFVNMEETSKESSVRILKKETGLKDVYMQEFCVSDGVKRDSRGRVISISYIALIDKSLLKEALNSDASWFDIKLIENGDDIVVNLFNGEETINYNVKRTLVDKKSNDYFYSVKGKKQLAFDHSDLLINGIMELRNKVNNTDIVFNLMPSLFTIGELKQVYELILNKKLINSAFRRVIANKIELTESIIKTGGHRPSVLCKYKGE